MPSIACTSALCKWHFHLFVCCRNCFTNCLFLKLLCDAIPIVYTPTSTTPDLTMGTLFNMVLSHSQFLPTMMAEAGDAAANAKGTDKVAFPPLMNLGEEEP